MIENFQFRNFYVIVFELLDINLFKYIKAPEFRGMKKENLRLIATQLLKSLSYLKQIGIIHCDLKPENIMFTDSSREEIKIVDFGSACTEYKSGFKYV